LWFKRAFWRPGASVRKPSLGAILFALIPFVAICFSVSLWDRIYPMILGLPFNFFWLIAWLLLTPLCMWGAYRQEAARASDPHRKDGDSP
jgi:amino acid transporter